MATYVNTPGDGNNGAGGWIIAIVVIIVLVLLALFLFPNLFAGRNDNDLDVTVPATSQPAQNPNSAPSVINNTFNSTTTVSTTTPQ